MVKNLEKICPKCQSEKCDPVSYFYKTLLQRGYGKDLFTQGPLSKTAPQLTEKQRQRLLYRLTPPKEPKRFLPAGFIAFMAFLISWMVTGALLIGKIGEKAYFIITMVFIFIVGTPFYMTLNLVIKEFRREISKFRRVKKAWLKQFICLECHHIFHPTK